MSKIVNKLRIMGDSAISDYLEHIDNIISIDNLYINNKVMREIINSNKTEEERYQLLRRFMRNKFNDFVKELYKSINNTIWIVVLVQLMFYMIEGGKPRYQTEYSESGVKLREYQQYNLLMAGCSLLYTIVNIEVADTKKKLTCLSVAYKLLEDNRLDKYNIGNMTKEDIEYYKIILDIVNGSSKEFETNKLIQGMTQIEKMRVLKEMTNRNKQIIDIARKECSIVPKINNS